MPHTNKAAIRMAFMSMTLRDDDIAIVKRL
jgi:hypothetical protein